MFRCKKLFDQCIIQMSYLVREYDYFTYCQNMNPSTSDCYRYIISKNKEKYHMY